MSLPAGVAGAVRVITSFCSWLSIQTVYSGSGQCAMQPTCPGRGAARSAAPLIRDPGCLLEEVYRGPGSRFARPGDERLHRAAGHLPDRTRVALRPAAGLDASDEVGHRLIEQRRLLLIHHVTGLGKHHQTGGDDALLEEQ